MQVPLNWSGRQGCNKVISLKEHQSHLKLWTKNVDIVIKLKILLVLWSSSYTFEWNSSSNYTKGSLNKPSWGQRTIATGERETVWHREHAKLFIMCRCLCVCVLAGGICVSVTTYSYLLKNNNYNLFLAPTNRLFICYCFEVALCGTVGPALMFMYEQCMHWSPSLFGTWSFLLGCTIIFQNDSGNKNSTYGLSLKTKHNGLLTGTVIQLLLICVFHGQTAQM